MNRERLDELRRDVGDDALTEVIALFLEEADAAANRLRHAGPAAGMADDMHMLKGAALNLGLDDLAALCAEAERAAGVNPRPVLNCYRQSRRELALAAGRLGVAVPPVG